MHFTEYIVIFCFFGASPLVHSFSQLSRTSASHTRTATPLFRTGYREIKHDTAPRRLRRRRRPKNGKHTQRTQTLASVSCLATNMCERTCAHALAKDWRTNQRMHACLRSGGYCLRFEYISLIISGWLHNFRSPSAIVSGWQICRLNRRSKTSPASPSSLKSRIVRNEHCAFVLFFSS